MFQNIINLVSFMINLIECLVINSCSVTVLDHILIILEKKHLTEQNSICFIENHPIRLPDCIQ